MVSGKLIGFVTGLVFMGPQGAVLGLILGHLYDLRIKAPVRSRRNMWNDFPQTADQLRRATYAMGVIVLGAKMAKADGRVSRTEIEAFKTVFHIREEDVDNVGRIFDQARKSVFGFEPYAMRLAQVFKRNPAVLEEILTGLFIIAASDSNGKLSLAETGFLSRVAVLFDFSIDDFVRIAARSGVQLPGYKGAPPDGGPYTVLGISPGASEEEIKKTYRALIRKHHPDALVAQGLPKELIDQANEKMKRINAAYADICKMRGIK